MKKIIFAVVAVMAMANGAMAGVPGERLGYNPDRVELAQVEHYCDELSNKAMNNVQERSFLGFKWETDLTPQSEELKDRCESASATLQDVFGKPSKADYQKAFDDRKGLDERRKAKENPEYLTEVLMLNDFSDSIIATYNSCSAIAGLNADNPFAFHSLAGKCRSAISEFKSVSKDYVKARNYGNMQVGNDKK